MECYGCCHLQSYADGAGGGIFKCDNTAGLVIGEYGHWTDDSDTPRPYDDDCYETAEDRDIRIETELLDERGM